MSDKPNIRTPVYSGRMLCALKVEQGNNEFYVTLDNGTYDLKRISDDKRQMTDLLASYDPSTGYVTRFKGCNPELKEFLAGRVDQYVRNNKRL